MTSPAPSQQALIKRQTDNALMPPPPPPKRIKRPATVLDEDTYTDALSHIIARDFFPGLLETQTKQEYLDALESKDKEWIENAGKKLSEVMTPGRARGRRGVSMTPRAIPTGGETPAGWGGDTPMSVASSTVSSSSTAQTARRDVPDVSNIGLGAFQAKYTSEDNESFYQLLDKQNTKRRENYAWMWSGNKIPTARQIAHRKREEKKLIDQGLNPENSNKDKQLAITTDMDARPAKPDTWKSGPENSFMFTPSGIEDTHQTVMQKAEAASRAGPKQVIYDNTRLRPAVESNEAAVPPSPSISAIKDAIAGRPRPTDTEPGYTGGETPRVNGYTFVDEDEPEPEPEIDQSHYFKLLGSTTGDSTPSPFQIKENRKREELHHRMVERAARIKRAEKAAMEIKTPVSRLPSSPMFASGRTPGGSTPGKALTPAAQKLLQRVGSTPKTSGMGSSSEPKNIWTPTPRRR